MQRVLESSCHPVFVMGRDGEWHRRVPACAKALIIEDGALTVAHSVVYDQLLPRDPGVDCGQRVVSIRERAQDHGCGSFEYPQFWNIGDGEYLRPRYAKLDLAGFGHFIGERLQELKEPPSFIICGSRGGQVTLQVVLRHYWRGPFICLNAAILTTDFEIPVECGRVCMITGGRDYFNTCVAAKFRQVAAPGLTGAEIHVREGAHALNSKEIGTVLPAAIEYMTAGTLPNLSRDSYGVATLNSGPAAPVMNPFTSDDLVNMLIACRRFYGSDEGCSESEIRRATVMDQCKDSAVLLEYMRNVMLPKVRLIVAERAARDSARLAALNATREAVIDFFKWFTRAESRATLSDKKRVNAFYIPLMGWSDPWKVNPESYVLYRELMSTTAGRESKMRLSYPYCEPEHKHITDRFETCLFHAPIDEFQKGAIRNCLKSTGDSNSVRWTIPSEVDFLSNFGMTVGQFTGHAFSGDRPKRPRV